MDRTCLYPSCFVHEGRKDRFWHLAQNELRPKRAIVYNRVNIVTFFWVLLHAPIHSSHCANKEVALAAERLKVTQLSLARARQMPLVPKNTDAGLLSFHFLKAQKGVAYLGRFFISLEGGGGLIWQIQYGQCDFLSTAMCLIMTQLITQSVIP